jgi:hypothetical protein
MPVKTEPGKIVKGLTPEEGRVQKEKAKDFSLEARIKDAKMSQEKL